MFALVLTATVYDRRRSLGQLKRPKAWEEGVQMKVWFGNCRQRGSREMVLYVRRWQSVRSACLSGVCIYESSSCVLSVLMTSTANESLDKALQWAIVHSGDDDFDVEPAQPGLTAQIIKEGVLSYIAIMVFYLLLSSDISCILQILPAQVDKMVAEHGVETRYLTQLNQSAKHYFCLEALLGTKGPDREVMALPLEDLIERVMLLPQS